MLRYSVGSINGEPSNIDDLEPEEQGVLHGLAQIMLDLCSKSIIYLD
jgi:hypothetical protein